MKAGRLRGPVHARAALSGESWSLEVQIHPSDIRKRVRYLFLSRGQLTAWSVGVLLYLLGLALAAAVAPGVVGGLMNRQEYHSLIAERTRQGERLHELVTRASRLDAQAAELDLRLGKILLAYGLPPARPRARKVAPAVMAAGAAGSIYAGTIEQGDRLRLRVRDRLMALEISLRAVQQFESMHPDQVRPHAFDLSSPRRVRAHQLVRQPSQPVYPGAGAPLRRRLRRAARDPGLRHGRRRRRLRRAVPARPQRRLVALRQPGDRRARPGLRNGVRPQQPHRGAAGTAGGEGRSAGDGGEQRLEPPVLISTTRSAAWESTVSSAPSIR